ncbi:MAG: hypothetical protein GF308_14705 [Candidatus Heimdallarchaeota archaeon]|nr:hypothetical protein [Candidatus Heimdallarchaeota archaeon]
MKKLRRKTNVRKDHVYIVPGNHDLDRTDVDKNHLINIFDNFQEWQDVTPWVQRFQ